MEMKLYEIANNYNSVLELLDNEEATEDEFMDTLNAINDALEVKVDNICRLCKYLDAKAKVYKEETKRLTAMARQAENRAASMKRYLDEQLKLMDIERMDTKLFKLFYRKSDTLKVLNINLVPDVYKKVTVDVDKMAIKAAIKAGKEIDGAELVINQNLQIR